MAGLPLAAHDVRAVELTTAPPHLFTRHFGSYERKDLARLLDRATAVSVTIALENSPYGYLGPAADLLGVVRDFAHPRLRVAYDLASALAQEDPAPRLAADFAALGKAGWELS